MAQTIEVGTLLIKDGTHLPETLAIESDPYLNGWSRVSNWSCSALDRKLTDADGPSTWPVRSLRWDSAQFQTRLIRRAVGNVIANMKSGRFNCLEISRN